jgi:hypothetical protein
MRRRNDSWTAIFYESQPQMDMRIVVYGVVPHVNLFRSYPPP